MSDESPLPGEIGQLGGAQCISHENVGEGIVYSLENPCSDPKCDICHEVEACDGWDMQPKHYAARVRALKGKP